ncbi:MFS transporter [Halobacillus ihumii]|uniref:MFS transporter n=1 Tax=Halobacillus ihumii TaxID=2686092 RepID=UPI0013D0E19B|nr:MFS transporter [Halobacillus ihumii]
MEKSTVPWYAKKEPPEFKKNGQVFRFIGGNLISFFGNQIYMIAIPLIVLSITGSPLSMGIVAALERLPILTQPFIGVLADRFDRKLILLSCEFGRFMIVCAVGVLYIMNLLLIWEIYVASLLVGIVSQIYNTSQFASIPRLVQKRDLQLVNSINTGVFNLAVFVAPALGGLLISLYNPGLALLLNGISFLIGFIILLSLKIDQDGSVSNGNKKFFSNIQEGFMFVLKQKPIFYTNLAMLFSIFGTTLFLTMLIVHLKSTISLNAAEIGWLLSAGGIGAIGGSLASNILRKIFTYRTILFVAGIVGGFSIILFSISDTYIWLVIMNAIGTVAASIMSPCIVTIRQNLTPGDLLGRVQASSRFMTWILMPASAFLSGVLAEYIGTSSTIFIGGIISMAASLIYLHPSLGKDCS